MELMQKNLKEAIFKVMEMMYFLLPEESGTEVYSVSIGITGDPEYLITFSVRHPLGVKMASDLLAVDEAEVTNDLIYQCLKETANIIAGNLLHSFPDEGNRNLTLPQISRWDVFGARRTTDRRDFSLTFNGQDMGVCVETVCFCNRG